MKSSSTWLGLCTVVLLAWQCIALSSDQIKLTVADLDFKDINAQNFNIDLKLTRQGLLVNATADSIILPEPIGLLKKVTLQCTELVLRSAQTTCTAGSLAFSHGVLGTQNVGFSVKATPENERYQLSISNLTIADANFSIIADYENANWRATVNTSQASLAKLVSFISPYLDTDKKALADGWEFDSDLIVKANLSGHYQQLDQLKLDLQASELNVSDQQGKYVTENVAMNVLVELILKKDTWLWKMDMKLASGQAYGEPVFVDFDDSALSVKATGEWQSTEEDILVSDAQIIHHDILQIKGRYSGSIQELQELDIIVQQADLTKLYSVWLQPFALGTAADKLEMAGKVALHYQQKANNYHLSVNLDDIFIDDEKSRFGLYNLNGHAGWTNNDMVMQTNLDWQGGYLYSVPFGQSNLQVESHSSSLSLIEPWSLPILDGALMVNEFSLEHSTDDKTQWVFDGLLTPISMEELSVALDWPLLHGKLSGVIPKVSYANKQVKVDGALMVKLFEGTTVIRDLHLNQPFDALPQLYANIDLMGLDLEILTQTFDFGKITGKLDGHLSNLRLSNWQPVQFDAHFATPEGDQSRRRISQKAIDNLSQIGGGVSGILSRSFLRFFEDFSYQKLGINCKLLNETCEMSGVGEAKQGYYIVKGGGLPPRINVVGYTRQVDWPDLIERLKAVSQSSGPVIQ